MHLASGLGQTCTRSYFDSDSEQTVLIVPGWRDSGPGHWQTLWASQLPGALRVHQEDWISPRRAAWVEAITRTILAQKGPVVTAAHSLGCIATTHLPPRGGGTDSWRVAGGSGRPGAPKRIGGLCPCSIRILALPQHSGGQRQRSLLPDPHCGRVRACLG